MAALEPYYFEPNMLQNRLEKIHFAELVKDAKLVAGFLLPANFESDGMTSDKHDLAAKAVSKWLASSRRSVSWGTARL